MNSRQRIALVVALAVALIGLGRLLLPFHVRYGRYVYQSEPCPPPVVRVLHSDKVAGEAASCRPDAVAHAEAGVILLALAGTGAVVAVSVLRDPRADAPG